MKTKEIREKARTLGIDPGRMRKKDLIHRIQIAEGYTACYGSFGSGCPYVECCFRSDCRREK